ncbi:MAG: homoserine O-acetyltransferase [Bdellovibrionaceae bacterium]|nr:homoserine O-acetyltransferase [Pseudobdellovibrionaceae bacterium]
MTTSHSGVGLVSKRLFKTDEFKLVSGRTIRNVQLGYETYGRLNERGDNTILVTHYFTGTSHCAGRYTDADLEPGYWDTLIGPGRALDTDRFFVVSIDSFCNVNSLDPHVMTTGPASLDPETEKPYGLRFPLISMQDLVRSQRLVLQSLGIEKLHAVCGPSMGAMQALEWAATFPNAVDRVLAVIPGNVESDPYLIARIRSWMMPILHDPHWNNGDYYDGPRPERGLADSLRLITLDALHYNWADRTFGRRPQSPQRDPASALENLFAVESAVDDIACMRARVADANSVLYIAKMVQAFNVRSRLADIRAKVLCLPVSTDLLLFPAYAAATVTALREAGVRAESFTLESPFGHLDGLHHIVQATDTIRRFLNA